MNLFIPIFGNDFDKDTDMLVHKRFNDSQEMIDYINGIINDNQLNSRTERKAQFTREVTNIIKDATQLINKKKWSHREIVMAADLIALFNTCPREVLELIDKSLHLDYIGTIKTMYNKFIKELTIGMNRTTRISKSIIANKDNQNKLAENLNNMTKEELIAMILHDND